MTIRRHLDLAGLGGLTPEHHAAWVVGRITLADIAAELGVGVPSVSRRFKRWRKQGLVADGKTPGPGRPRQHEATPDSPAPARATRSAPATGTAPAATDASGGPPASPAGPVAAPAAAPIIPADARPATAQQEPLPAFTSADASDAAKSCAAAILVQTHRILTAPGALSPSALKAATVAVENAVTLLARFGAIDMSEGESKPTVLTIRCLAQDEEAEIQRKAERGHLFGDDDDCDGDQDAGEANGADQGASSSETSFTNEA